MLQDIRVASRFLIWAFYSCNFFSLTDLPFCESWINFRSIISGTLFNFSAFTICQEICEPSRPPLAALWKAVGFLVVKLRSLSSSSDKHLQQTSSINAMCWSCLRLSSRDSLRQGACTTPRLGSLSQSENLSEPKDTNKTVKLQYGDENDRLKEIGTSDAGSRIYSLAIVAEKR